MESAYARTLASLTESPRRWLVTGCAGFIGSHLVAKLLECGQHVRGLDNFSTGKNENLNEVRAQVGEMAWSRFHMMHGDICDAPSCHEAACDVDVIVHEAAFVSVPLSIENPAQCNRINIDGFLNILHAARTAGVNRFVYASSSAIYGDATELPSREDVVGIPTSPYGASKLTGEKCAEKFSLDHGITTVGLRYFNVFGARQDPSGGYPAVIPKWIATSLAGMPCRINGDGSHTRDFCHVANVVQANILAAMTPLNGSSAFNVGLGGRLSLGELCALIADEVQALTPGRKCPAPIHGPARSGDIVHSQADISKIRRILGYEPQVGVRDGVRELVRWHAVQSRTPQGPAT